MKLNVFLTDDAEETLYAVLLFVKLKWGEKAKDKLKKIIVKKLRLIASQPYMFEASSVNNNVRKGHISKQTSFFYEVNDDYIMILYFWDNRQDPIID